MMEAFGEDAASRAISGLLIYQKFFMISIFIGFLFYPYFDVKKKQPSQRSW